MSRSEFALCISEWEKKLSYWYFVAGKPCDGFFANESKPSSAFVVFENPSDILDFCRFLQSEFAARPSYAEKKPQLELCLIQNWAKNDLSQSFPELNTLDESDDFYANCLVKMSSVDYPQKELSNASSNASTEESQKSEITPLLSFLSQKEKILTEKKKEKRRERRKKEKIGKKQFKNEKPEGLVLSRPATLSADKRIVIAKRPSTIPGLSSEPADLKFIADAVVRTAEDNAVLSDFQKPPQKPRKSKKGKTKAEAKSPGAAADLHDMDRQAEILNGSAKKSSSLKPEPKKKTRKAIKTADIKDFKSQLIDSPTVESPV